MEKCQPPEALLEWLNAINSGDLQQLAGLMAPNHVFYVEGESPTTGVDANTAAWQGYFSAFPKYTIYVDALYVNEGTYFLVGHTSGSHVPDDLESVPESVIWKARLAEDRVTEWIIFDGSRRVDLGIPQKTILVIE